MFSSSDLGSASDQGLRVVFQYNGLLEAGPTGGYKRLTEPGRLVTWSPHTQSHTYKQNKRAKWRKKTETALKRKPDVSYEDVKLSLMTRSPPPPVATTSAVNKLVTWVPRMSGHTINQPAGSGTQNKDSESDTSQGQHDSLARKEVLFVREPAIRPKNVFYNQHKADRVTDLVWTGPRNIWSQMAK